MKEDLRPACLTVCESSRDSYVGYASISTAGTAELVERLMTVSIVVGRSFEEFYAEHYRKGFGLPDGPSGAHGALRHGGDASPLTRDELAKTYRELSALPAVHLVTRLRADFGYFPDAAPAAEDARVFAATDVAGLYRTVVRRDPPEP